MNDELKTYPCPRCNLPVKQGGHWNEALCFHALMNRVRELEGQVERHENFLVRLVLDNHLRTKVFWLAQKAFFNGESLVGSLLRGEEQKFEGYLKVCLDSVKELRKELGL